MRAALGAELARHRVREFLPLEPLRRPLRVGEARLRHAHHDVRMPARDVLAFATMALPLEHGVARGPIAKRAAVTSTLDLHETLPSPTRPPHASPSPPAT